jgi:hypothetical protein
MAETEAAVINSFIHQVNYIKDSKTAPEFQKGCAVIKKLLERYGFNVELDEYGKQYFMLTQQRGSLQNLQNALIKLLKDGGPMAKTTSGYNQTVNWLGGVISKKLKEHPTWLTSSVLELMDAAVDIASRYRGGRGPKRSTKRRRNKRKNCKSRKCR